MATTKRAPARDRTAAASCCGGPAAFRSPRALAIFLAIALGGLAADLLSKHHAFESLLGAPSVAHSAQRVEARLQEPTPANVLRAMSVSRPLMPGIGLTLSTNPGIVFGLPMPRWIVAIATVVTVTMVALFFASSPARALSMHVAMGAILGGALGNLYDRLFAAVHVPGLTEPIRYQVRDFIDASQLHYPYIFNIADVLLVVGVALVLLNWILTSLRMRRAGSS